ncbi:MAG: tetratricopeptide repeat protein [Hyphomicrobiaceae bacterium]
MKVVFHAAGRTAKRARRRVVGRGPLLGLAVLAAGLLAPVSHTGDAAPANTDDSDKAHFVGSQACSSCHGEAYAQWQNSHHHRAMQEATEKTVLGNFNDADYIKDGIKSTFFKRDGKYWVRTDGPDGVLADFEIRYTFGFSPLQQYLIALPGGRLQALGIAWDARPTDEGGQRWYHLYPDQAIKAGDPLHWTGIDQNWNFQCAWCHSTNLQKNYSTESKTYRTTWSEISVGCEACHGPASGHVTWAAKAGGDGSTDPAKGFAFKLDERRGVSWLMGAGGQAARSQPRASAKEVDVCATCHARRQQFSSDAGSIGRLFDAFRPSLLEAGLYHVDGQQRDEVYKYGSFIQSKMFAAGVTCSDCHNPHSGKLYESGNGVCTKCHASEKFDGSAHHRHPAGTVSLTCAACHMPATTYMGVDARHDHSFRIPRPDRTYLLGTPNACNSCHKDKPASWARDAVRAWHPSPNPGMQNFAEAFDLGDRRAPGAQLALARIAGEPGGANIARASALLRLSSLPSPFALDVATRSLAIDDPLVRVAAISIVAGADVTTRRSRLVPLLRDQSRLVRMEAARSLVGEPSAGLPSDEHAAFDTAIGEYVAGQLFNGERPEAHVNLGNLYLEQGKPDAARASFRTAVELDRSFVAASITLAEVERSQGNEAAAEAILRSALESNPNSGLVEHALGLSFIRQGRVDKAMEYLARAAEHAPDSARFAYVLAVALHDTGKAREAIEALKRGLLRNPYDRDLLSSLVSYEMELGNFTAALEQTELLDRLEPNSPSIAQLLARLRRQVH